MQKRSPNVTASTRWASASAARCSPRRSRCMAAKGEDTVESVTYLATMLDFEAPGQLGVFIDEKGVAAREAAIGKGGILPGADLASTFNALRANDLIWPYVVNNYLMGGAPAAFDLLYWNADSTNLPGPDVLQLRAQHLPREQAARARRAAATAAWRWTWARWTGPRSSSPRARTTSCPGARPTARSACSAARSSSCSALPATSRASSIRRRAASAAIWSSENYSGRSGRLARAGEGRARQLVAAVVAVAGTIQGRQRAKRRRRPAARNIRRSSLHPVAT